MLLVGARAGSQARGALRAISFGSFVAACAFVWAVAPRSLSAAHFDPMRGVAGMFGWALYALAYAAAPSARSSRSGTQRPADDAGGALGTSGAPGDSGNTDSGGSAGSGDSATRTSDGWADSATRASGGLHADGQRAAARVDRACLAIAVLAAALVQLAGWGIARPEAALLVRFVSLAAGLAILGFATRVSLLRNRGDARCPPSVRVRRTVVPTLLVAAALAMLLLADRG